MTTLTPLELDIMKSLWRRRAARVREVQADLRPDRKLAYTTVMTVLDRLFRKGAVSRTKKARAHVYEPEISEGAMRAQAVAGLLDDYFGGSRTALGAFIGSAAESEAGPGEAGPPQESRPLPEREGAAAQGPGRAGIDESLL